MSKQLILFRHGKAEEKQTRQADYDRKLTEKGILEARNAALWLKVNYPQIDKIWASSAVRTAQTAQIFASIFLKSNMVELIPEIYEENDVQLLERIRCADNKIHALAIVGHNPFLSLLAQYLASDNSIQLQTASVAILRFYVAQWQEVSASTLEFYKVYHPQSSIPS
ncbi:MAG: phosphohistidine phosphatase SixA [Cytophagales bacterium]|nr:phosphohistidine phosphatase SixA [Cytophagales bacterium]MDW8384940.1 phosphohistidine phosphatase SixA [Flammeovirgaceae bacterium]